jgi:endonuclease-3 related protein
MTALRRKPQPRSKALREIFARLEAAYGAETWHWSPDYVRGPIDVIVGAILVQHTVWANAERALEGLRAAGALDTRVLASMPDDDLLPLIRVSGTPNVKARRLRAIASTIETAGGMDAFLALADDDLRERLLATHGVGPETADGIMLYAAGRRVFMVDAYTQRLFRRIGLGPAADRYGDWQRHLEDALPGGDVAMFQRSHACIVLHGKALCRAKPLCERCPLSDICETGRGRA